MIIYHIFLRLKSDFALLYNVVDILFIPPPS